MHGQASTGGGDFAASLRADFEQALKVFIRSLSTHSELVEYATRTGHRTRPVGCLLACAAVEGDWRLAIDTAIGVELIHKSSVIRDDIVDGDEVRSGQSAPHIVYGLETAIAVSDYLWTAGLRQVAKQPSPLQADRCLHESATVLGEMAAGQLEDVSPTISLEDVEHRLAVEERKTGSLSELACRLGGIIGGGGPDQLEALGRYGRKLGTAFQILNDVRNLLGEETARSQASDIRNRRDTILTAYARGRSAGETRALLEEARSGPEEMTAEEVQAVREVLLNAGAIKFGEEIAERMMAEARAELVALSPSRARDVFESLAREALLAYAF
ncbi:MAG: polyprenyl synthetase family protein [Solirubrobacterales bacterium]